MGSKQAGPARTHVARIGRCSGSGVAHATSIHLLGNRACARLQNGELVCWGDSIDCGDDDSTLPPAVVPAAPHQLQVLRAEGGSFWCSLSDSKDLTCEGLPETGDTFTMSHVTTAAAGPAHACAARSDGSVWCWGDNPCGELGQPTEDATHPEPLNVLWPREFLRELKQMR